MLNHITLQGRLTKDGELRYTNSNKPVCSFSVACERDTKGADGNRVADFFDCVAWNGGAEFVHKYFHKGDMIAVSGRLQNREWADNDGNKHRVTEIIADNTYFCGGKAEKSDAPKRSVDELSKFSNVNFTGVQPKFDELPDDGELPF